MKTDKNTNIVFIILGHVFTGLGAAGIFLPLLPTTPFLLLAAACYAKGSKKFYDRLMNHRVLGGYIKNYRKKRGIKLKVKIYVLVLLWATIGISAFFIVKFLWVKILLLAIAGGVTIHILSFKTLNED